MNRPMILEKDLVSTSPEVKEAIIKIAEVAAELQRIISRSKVDQLLSEASETNSDVEDQKKLNIIADRAYKQNLKTSGVRYYVSEGDEVVIELNTSGCIAIAIDPLDGSDNIDTNVSFGSIFSIRQIEDKNAC